MTNETPFTADEIRLRVRATFNIPIRQPGPTWRLWTFPPAEDSRYHERVRVACHACGLRFTLPGGEPTSVVTPADTALASSPIPDVVADLDDIRPKWIGLPPCPGWYLRVEPYRWSGVVWVGLVRNVALDKYDRGLSWGQDPTDDPEWERAEYLEERGDTWTPVPGPQCDDCDGYIAWDEAGEAFVRLHAIPPSTHADVGQECPK